MWFIKSLVTSKIKSAILLVLLCASPVFSQCDPNWKPGNGPQGVDNWVYSLIKWDPDGNGPQSEQVVIGGPFSSVAGVAANNVAIWDGSNWKPMGGGLPGHTRVFAIYNGQLFSGGEGYAGVYRWNGSNWERLSGSEGFLVYSMTVYNGQLIIGESVSNTGCHLYSWDGNNLNLMSTMTGGTYGPYIDALTVYNGELIAGGDFNVVEGVECNRIARWDGYNWHPLGSGINGAPFAFTIYNNELIIGGGFTSAGGMDANDVVRWDGTNFYPMGKGLAGGSTGVRTFAVYNNELIAGGGFNKSGDLDANQIARWDGNSWQTLGSGVSPGGVIFGLTEYNGELIAVGDYSKVGGVTANGLGRWDGSQWRAFGNGIGFEPGNYPPVQCLTVYKNELIAAGLFRNAGGIDTNYIARWDGSSWKSLGSGINAGPNFTIVNSLTIYNDDLIVGGRFTRAGGVDANGIALWDGSNWQPLGGGVGRGNIMPNNPVATVSSLTTYSSQLIVGGDFNLAGGIDVNEIAAWNGSDWHSLGSGFNGPGLPQVSGGYGVVYALTAYKGDLIAGGNFNSAGGVDVNGIARWDGNNWQSLGSGVAGTRFSINALLVYDGNLIAAGSFTKAGGIDVNNIAVWDGSNWQSMGGGLNSNVYALTIYNGSLIAGGYFFKTGPSGVAQWDGSNWLPIGSGVSGSYPDVVALTSYKGDLIAGGWFEKAGGVPSNYWARWGVPGPIEGDLNHDCFVDWLDLYLLVERWLDDDCLHTGWCYEADLNYDLKVDFEDYAKLTANWNPPIVGDFNLDGKVDINDLAILAGYWLQNNPQIDIAPPGGDSIVNFLDFAAFAANWN